MDIQVTAVPGLVPADGLRGELRWRDKVCRCALGRGGISAAKREGDGTTPAGRFLLGHVYYRADRLDPPPTGLAARALDPSDGWCDAPADPNYNLPVRHPYPTSAEHLWRQDPLYDLMAVIEHNAAPVAPGAGSAIFLHVAATDYGPTEGCVALALEDLQELLAACTPGDWISIAAII